MSISIVERANALFAEVAPPKKYAESHRREICEAQKRSIEKIRVVSFNILFKLMEHKTDPKLSWDKRLPLVIQTIKDINPDILGVQECYQDQLKDIFEHLGGVYAYFTGDISEGELNAIFYKKELFEIVLGGEFPTSFHELPLDPKDDEIVSTVPDYLPPTLEPGRRLTLVNLVYKHTGRCFCVMNTHLTFHRINSRELQALYIENLAKRIFIPVILLGDFNTFPNLPETSLPFYDGDRIGSIFKRSLLYTRETSLLGHLGPIATGIKDFFRPLPSGPDAREPLVVLDQIYVSRSIQVILTATIPSERPHPSDHYPVLADILLDTA
ncbi:MAG: hypothetical protein FJZ59_01285 [Chlamydiae bacterium]|jgi:endonuclease/exonuclease/phosphatase family metal-dependent hydrolase|nr:hypothetical protein [Chlamydiota bacterium]